MSQQTMRGMRLGTQSLESDKGIHFSARNKHLYQCVNDHVSEIVFSADADVPETWQCKKCSNMGTLLADGKRIVLTATEDKTPRSHWEMLLERRTREELEEILQERIEYIRTKRDRGQADL